MASEIWFVSDTHFFHSNILKFTGDDGKRVRPEFSSTEEMNEHMVERWNSVVKPGDKVYHLGDVSFRYDRPFRELMARLQGQKRLILGNHDIIKGTTLTDYFKKVSLWRLFKDEEFLCTHIPCRLDQLRKARVNVHGHIHQNIMDDPRYINLCVEHHDYTPRSMEWIKEEIKRRGL